MKYATWVAFAVVLTLGGPFLHAQSTTHCTLSTTNRTVTVCTPESRSSTAAISSPVRVVAACTDSASVSNTQIWVNGQKVTQYGSNQVDVTIPMASGNNNIGVVCKDASGYFSSSVNTAVSGGCQASGPGTLVACEPAADSTVDSPVHFVARDFDPQNQIHGMRIVNSGTSAVLFQTCGRNLDAWIKLPAGTYNFSVESLYTCGQTPPGNAQGVQLGPITVR